MERGACVPDECFILFQIDVGILQLRLSRELHFFKAAVLNSKNLYSRDLMG